MTAFKERKPGKIHARCQDCFHKQNREYRQSPKGREAVRRYRKSWKGRFFHLRQMRHYNSLPSTIVARKKYKSSPRAKAMKKAWESSRSGMASTLWRYYKISIEDFEKKLKAQKGACAICRKKNKGKKRLAIDHDHATERIRGLLCRNCNLMLGYAKDSALILKTAIEYLKKYRLDNKPGW